MIDTLISWSLRNRAAILVMAALLLVVGGYTAVKMPVDVFPEFSPSQVVIQTEAPGLSAELDERGRYFTSGAYLSRGQIVHVHRKVYLPTYGMFDEGRFFDAGDSIRAFDTRFGRMAILICEAPIRRFSSTVRLAKMPRPSGTWAIPRWARKWAGRRWWSCRCRRRRA